MERLSSELTKFMPLMAEVPVSRKQPVEVMTHADTVGSGAVGTRRPILKQHIPTPNFFLLLR